MGASAAREQGSPSSSPSSAAVPQPVARRWEDLDDLERLTLAKALVPQEGGPLRLALVAGSPVLAAGAAATLGAAFKAVMLTFYATWIGLVVGGLLPFFIGAIRRRYMKRTSGLSRAELKKARVEAPMIVAAYEARPPVIEHLK